MTEAGRMGTEGVGWGGAMYRRSACILTDRPHAIVTPIVKAWYMFDVAVRGPNQSGAVTVS